MALIDKLIAIADAIREKTGSSEQLTLDRMAEEISSISSGDGSGETLKTLLDATKSCHSLFYTYTGTTVEGLIKYPDTSSVTDMSNMFQRCPKLTSVPLLDTSSVTDMDSMFYVCSKLTSIPLLDLRKVTGTTYMFYGCSSLTDCVLKNIKTSLQVGSGSKYGHLLTVDSLIGLIRELRDTGSTKTLTIGTTNLSKISSIYVRTIDITDEMRAEDDLIDEKLPFEICESTDDNAKLITEYVTLKHWALA